MRIIKNPEKGFTTICLTGDDLVFLFKNGAIVKEDYAVLYETAVQARKEEK